MLDQVIIIRHAEKPLNSDENDQLSAPGFDRAQRLVNLYKVQPELRNQQQPTFLFAAKYIPGKSSQRSLQTLEPLAKFLGLPIQTPFRSKEYEKLARQLLEDPKYDGQRVLISWTHLYLPKLARALGSAPRDEWDENIFDRIWILDFSPGGKVNSFELVQKI